MKKTDLWWLCGYPIYQLIGTIRHELSHAGVAVLQGVTLTEIKILPSYQPGMGYYWGYVRWTGGDPTWLVDAAPYLNDLILAAVCVPLCLRFRSLPRWIWMNLFILGLVSPLLNLAYNYFRSFFASHNDVAVLLHKLPDLPVHFALLSSLLAIGYGAIWVSRSAPP